MTDLAEKVSLLPAPELPRGRPRLIVTGFMGTGKSTAASEAATILELPFVDLDRLIERRTGRRIPEIFAESGEPAFRAMERDAMSDVARLSGVVVATGGGAVMQEAAFAELAAGAEVVVLTADPEVLVRRVRAAGDARPMLVGDDVEDRVRELMAERAPRYAAFGEPIDTSHAIRRVAGREAADRYRRRSENDSAHARIDVPGPDGAYPVLIGRGALERLPEELCAALPALASVAVAGGAAVSGLVDRIRADLEGGGVKATGMTIPGDEATKTVDTVASLWDRFLEAGLSRTDAVVAVGGGATLDAVGFAAATYARGVPLANVPTTLLAMVDASLGGKVGVDHAGAKNLVGSFHHPSLVIADPNVLGGLPAALVRHGLAEAVKEAALASPAMLDVLATAPSGGEGVPRDLDWIVEQAVRIKAAYVGADPGDAGLRHSLNLGHTFAHAIEAASGYAVPHGEAVAIGTVAAARLGERLGITPPGMAGRLAALLAVLRLPVDAPSGLPDDAMLAAMNADKKRRGGRSVFVVPAPGGAALIEGLEPRVALASLVERWPR